MLDDLDAIELHRKYLATKDTPRPEGELRFRNCDSGCPAANWFRTTQQLDPTGKGDVAIFAGACRDCDLKERPGVGASVVMQLAAFPLERVPAEMAGSVVLGLERLARRRRML